MAPVAVGIAGLGRSGWNIHAKTIGALPDQFRVVAVSDPDPARRAEAHETLGCRAYDHVDALIGDDTVELVVVATPNRLHTEHAVAALEAGRHVVCEKPFALSTADADRTIQAAERAGRVLAPFQNRRYEPHFRKVLDVVASGVLGEVLLVRLAWHSFGRRWDWQTLLEFGGGLLSNNGPHILDQAVHFLGDGTLEIFADLRNTLSSGDAEDHVKVVVKGATGPTVDVELTSASAITQDRWHLMGTAGGLTGGVDELRWRWVEWSGMPPRPVDRRPTPDRSYNREPLEWHEARWTAPKDAPPENRLFYRDLYRTLREGRPLTITPQSVRRYVAILDYCRRAYAARSADTAPTSRVVLQ